MRNALVTVRGVKKNTGTRPRQADPAKSVDGKIRKLYIISVLMPHLARQCPAAGSGQKTAGLRTQVYDAPQTFASRKKQLSGLLTVR